MTRFAALGDSITLGVGDPVRSTQDRPGAARITGGASWGGCQFRGWAALLADCLPDPELHILADNGARVADIERHQLPRALEIRPDIASVVVGINDTLRPGFDSDRLAAALAHVVGGLRACGAQVLTMRLPDAGVMLGLPGALARPLGRRTREINAVVDSVATRFGTLHFDAAGTPAAYERRMWAVDRLHPNERGHRFIAGAFRDLLALAGEPVGPGPDPEPSEPPPTRLAQLAWMSTKGTAWVLRRSTDLVPYLALMAAKELRAGRDQPALPAK
jgi:lysophospholipase L1-like esterase